MCISVIRTSSCNRNKSKLRRLVLEQIMIFADAHKDKYNIDSSCAESSNDREVELETAPETVLLILPDLESDFHKFLELVDFVERDLSKTGSNEIVQVASFHPDYLFAEENHSDASHYTNRSPHPILHLLLVDKVTEAIDNYGDTTDSIWKKNKQFFKGIGVEKAKKMFSSIKQYEPPQK